MRFSKQFVQVEGRIHRPQNCMVCTIIGAFVGCGIIPKEQQNNIASKPSYPPGGLGGIVALWCSGAEVDSGLNKKDKVASKGDTAVVVDGTLKTTGVENNDSSSILRSEVMEAILYF